MRNDPESKLETRFCRMCNWSHSFCWKHQRCSPRKDDKMSYWLYNNSNLWLSSYIKFLADKGSCKHIKWLNGDNGYILCVIKNDYLIMASFVVHTTWNTSQLDVNWSTLSKTHFYIKALLTVCTIIVNVASIFYCILFVFIDYNMVGPFTHFQCICVQVFKHNCMGAKPFWPSCDTTN